jgi:glycosyltransferase involved in cell wall biosynthesis
VAALASRTPGVILLPYVTDANLRWLYAEATGFVLASHLEGFGMPVAEAMENGLIPVVSAGSVLEEVAGEGALSVDPNSEESIAAGMARVVSLNENARAERVALLKHQVRQFSEGDFRAKWREVLTA